jgi:hypothetical protein
MTFYPSFDAKDKFYSDIKEYRETEINEELSKVSYSPDMVEIHSCW